MVDEISSVQSDGDTPLGTMPDVAALEAELERLRAENEALATKAARPSHPGRARHVWSVILIVTGALLIGLAVPAVWLNRTIMQTDQWVATMAPLASDPAIQDAVAEAASAAIVERVDAERLAKEALPDKAQILATPIANAVNSFITDQTYKVVRSDKFAEIWTEANRVGHKTVIALVAEQQGEVLTSESGKVTIDLTALLEEVQQQLVDRGLSFVAKIPVERLPNKEITLVDSPALANAGAALKLLNQTALMLSLLALGALGGAVAAAVNRRRAVLWVGIAIVIAMVLPIEAVFLAQYPYVAAIEKLGVIPTPAAQSMYAIIFRQLVFIQRNVLIFGLVLWAAAIVAGPARWAVALRGGIQHGMQGVGTAWDFGGFGEWVLAHKQVLRTTGLVLAVLALVFLQSVSPLARLVWAGVLVLLWLLAIELFGRPRPSPAEGVLAESTSADATADVPLRGTDPPAGS